MPKQYELPPAIGENEPEQGYIVDRPELHTQLQDAMYRDSTMTWVHGPRGSGKSVAVSRVLEQNGDTARWITGQNIYGYFNEQNKFDPMWMRSQMVKEYRRQLNSLAYTDGDTPDHFAKFLRTPQAPGHVVIDNYDPEAFPQLIKQQESPFITHVTVISRDPPPENIWIEVNRIEVGPLAADESHELIGCYFPDASSDDRNRVADIFSGNALLIDQASQMYREYGGVIENLLSEIEHPQNLVMLIDVAEEGHRYRYQRAQVALAEEAFRMTRHA